MHHLNDYIKETIERLDKLVQKYEYAIVVGDVGAYHEVIELEEIQEYLTNALV